MNKIVNIAAVSDDVEAARARAAAACEAEMGARGLSRARAAREIGVDAGSLSKWLRGVYEADPAPLTAKVLAWLETRREARALDPAPSGLGRHVDLGVTGRIESALALAQGAGVVVLVHGPSGAGKSWALDHFAKARSGVHRATMTGAVATMAGLLFRVADAVGAGPRHLSALAAESAVISRLEGRGALLAIDEAHHLSAPLLDELRCVADHAGCGLALVGGDEIRPTLARCPQVTGRIGVRVALRVPSRADVLDLARAVLGRDPARDETKRLVAAAHGPGGLHALGRLLMRAWMIARAEGSGRIGSGEIAVAAEDAASC